MYCIPFILGGGELVDCRMEKTWGVSVGMLPRENFEIKSFEMAFPTFLGKLGIVKPDHFGNCILTNRGINTFVSYVVFIPTSKEAEFGV